MNLHFHLNFMQPVAPIANPPPSIAVEASLQTSASNETELSQLSTTPSKMSVKEKIAAMKLKEKVSYNCLSGLNLFIFIKSPLRESHSQLMYPTHVQSHYPVFMVEKQHLKSSRKLTASTLVTSPIQLMQLSMTVAMLLLMLRLRLETIFQRPWLQQRLQKL